MKKIIATLLALSMLLSMVTIPASAADIQAGVLLKVEYNKDTGIVKLSGTMSKVAGRNWATFYLLNPGKNRDDLKNHTSGNPVFSNYGEFEANEDGTFSYEFKHNGAEGVYTLYFSTGYAQITRQIDTSKSVVSEAGRLEALKSLATSYSAPVSTTVEELFKEKRAELPEEMPVIQPAKIEGLFEIFVDVKNGDDDTATGSIDSPYKTINAALKAHTPETGMVLYLREGTYPITDSVDLKYVQATEELPFIISNYNDEEVIVTGGTPIDGNDFEKISDQDIIQRLSPEVIDDIVVIDLKEKYGMTEFGDIAIDSQPVLYVGDSQYTIARWPNSGNTNMLQYKGEDQEIGMNGASPYETGVIDCGKITTSAGSVCGPYREHSKRYAQLLEQYNGDESLIPQEEKDAKTGFEFCVEDLRPFSWAQSDDIWIYGKFYGDWTLEHYNVWKMDPEKRSIRTKTGLSYGCRYYNSTSYKTAFYYYNVLEELDAPGEWYMDKKSGKLYVYPSCDLASADISYAYSNQTELWKLQSCENVIINGIKFDKARTRAITVTKRSNADKSEGVIIQNCSFTNMNEGVLLTKLKYSGVINSTFKDMSAKGVTISHAMSDETRNLIPARMFIQNNVFYNTTGINVSGVGNIVSHNFISNNKGTNVSVTGNENIVEYNEFVAGPRVVDDAGCIYFNGNNLFNRGNHARYNYFHDLTSGGRSIYFDDMLSENYAYGNVVDGGWMQLHTGSDNTAYNNVFMNYTSSEGEGPIRVGNNYWRNANNASQLWVKGTLNYGSFTSRLKASEGYGGDETNNTLTGAFAVRYPRLVAWANLMYKRIDEYEAAGKTTAAAKTSSIMSDYTHTYQYTKSEKVSTGNWLEDWLKPTYKDVTYTVNEQVNLNEYLGAARDNVFVNNIFVNCAKIKVDNPRNENGTYSLPFTHTTSGEFTNYTTSGYIRNIDRNNAYLTTNQNPFADFDFESEYNLEAARYYVPGFEAIPFSKIGLMDEEDYVANGKVNAINPSNTTEIAVSGKDLSLQWSSVAGAQKYTVELASDAEFGNILESKTTFDLSYIIETALESDKTYYWRVTTQSQAICATGEVEVSDTFKFQTMSETVAKERNQVGVTIYSVDDMSADNFKVTTYAYNGTDAEKKVTIHIACYDEKGGLISTKSQIVTIPADKGLTEENENNSTVSDEIAYTDADFQNNAFSSEIVFNFTAPNTTKIKLFVWDANGNMVPYTFVKTIQ